MAAGGSTCRFPGVHGDGRCVLAPIPRCHRGVAGYRAGIHHAAPVAASQEPLPEAGRQKLVGRWQRADANYVLEIRAVAADGQMDAIYWNPQPIHVSKAKATSESGKMTVIVELRDRLYPGSYYTLAYDPGKDQLAGVYHHLGVHQDYDVVFTRIGQN